MTSEQSLLQAIWDSYATDDYCQHLLIYADWLEEHGQADRAELLRLGQEVDDNSIHLEQTRQGYSRIQELVEKNKKAWLGKPPKDLDAHIEIDFIAVSGVPDAFLTKAARKWWSEFEPWVESIALQECDDFKKCQQLFQSGLFDSVPDLDWYIIDDEDLRLLPELAKLKSLVIMNGAALTDRSFEYLSAAPELRAIDAPDAFSITDSGIAHLGEISTLRSLSIPVTSPYASGESFLAFQDLKWFQDLEIGHNVTEKGMKAIGKLRSLKTLTVRNQDLPDTSLKQLGQLANLERLKISLQWTDKGLKHLGKLPQLRNLNLSASASNNATPEALTSLKAPHLEHLDFASNQLKNNDLKHLTKFPQLRVFKLTYSPISSEALVHIACLPELRSLCLNSTRVAGKGLRHLQTLEHLEELSLRHTRFSDAGIRYLLALPSLRAVDVSCTKVSKEGVEKLRAAKPGLFVRHDETDVW